MAEGVSMILTSYLFLSLLAQGRLGRFARFA